MAFTYDEWIEWNFSLEDITPHSALWIDINKARKEYIEYNKKRNWRPISVVAPSIPNCRLEEKTGEVSNWCKDNCIGQYEKAKYSTYNRHYEFELEEDVVAFKLRWC